MHFNDNNENTYDSKMSKYQNNSLFQLETENPSRFSSFSSQRKAASSDKNSKDQTTCQTNQIIPFMNNSMKQKEKMDFLLIKW